MKKSLRPQQAAPIQRENAGTAKGGDKGLVPQLTAENAGWGIPFAGDDSE
ncbi:MAG: anacyclamide/piricyclamide family prenylated cyclic peptide [Coleofasciculus sp. C2-GNP5-27]